MSDKIEVVVNVVTYTVSAGFGATGGSEYMTNRALQHLKDTQTILKLKVVPLCRLSDHEAAMQKKDAEIESLIQQLGIVDSMSVEIRVRDKEIAALRTRLEAAEKVIGVCQNWGMYSGFDSDEGYAKQREARAALAAYRAGGKDAQEK